MFDIQTETPFENHAIMSMRNKRKNGTAQRTQYRFLRHSLDWSKCSVDNLTTSSRIVDIPLTQGFIAQVDEIDADLSNFKWQARRKQLTVYAQRGIRSKDLYQNIQLHQVILERVLGRPLETDEQVDHRDHNGLNNTRGNLRLATDSQNNANRRLNKNNTSGMKGVRWHKGARKWQAVIAGIHLGYFTSLDDAGRAYNAKAFELYGEYALLNPVSEGQS